jgi:hypothetical protein
MGDIAPQGGYVSDLRSTYEFAGLDQGGRLTPQSGMLDDLAERDGRADQDVVRLESSFLQLRDRREVHQGVKRGLVALLEVQQEVGPTGDHARWTRALA